MTAGRIEIDDVQPVVSGGRFPAKAVVGEVVPVTATVWREGHEAVSATLVVRYHGATYPALADEPPGRVRSPEPVPIQEVVNPTQRVRPLALPMQQGRTPDVFHGQFSPDTVGLWTYRVDGWGAWQRRRFATAADIPYNQPYAPYPLWWVASLLT